MYIALTEKEAKKINEISQTTGTGIELINNELIEVSDLTALLFDLLCEYNHKVEELEDLKSDLNEHYTLKHVDEYEEYGVSRNDF